MKEKYILLYTKVGWLLLDSWQNSIPPIHHIFVQFLVPFVLHNIRFWYYFSKSFVVQWLRPPKTEVWTLFPKFFTANILFWKYLGVMCFRPNLSAKAQEFLIFEKKPSLGVRSPWLRLLALDWLIMGFYPNLAIHFFFFFLSQKEQKIEWKYDKLEG